MSLTRREFLRGMGGILAAGVAPAFIGSNVLMPVKKMWTPHVLWGDGVHDDTEALQAFFDGLPVVHPSGLPVGKVLRGGEYRLGAPIVITHNPKTEGIVATDMRWRLAGAVVGPLRAH